MLRYHGSDFKKNYQSQVIDVDVDGVSASHRRPPMHHMKLMGRKCRRNNKRGDRKVGQAIVTWTVGLGFRDLKLSIPADACIIQVIIDSLGKSDCASPSMSMNAVSIWLRDTLNPAAS
jgi:hypothetical protein